MAEHDGFNLTGDMPTPHAFVQWKGTDVCMDFWCDCGAEGHFDGYFAYVVECPDCHALWEMPAMLYPRKSERKEPRVMFEKDEER